MQCSEQQQPEVGSSGSRARDGSTVQETAPLSEADGPRPMGQKRAGKVVQYIQGHGAVRAVQGAEGPG